jgi:glycosyltransferase involved in cell wall biosynthesis
MKDLADRSRLFPEVVHIPNCLDPMFLKPPDTRNVTSDSRALRVVAVASDWSDKRKGLNLLLEVAKRVATTTNAKFTLVGKIPNGLEPQGWNVEFLGSVPAMASLIQILDASDVFLNLSSADNLPSTLIEAQARELPVVTGSAGGCPEVVADGFTGLVRDSVEDISRALEHLSQDRELVARLGRAGRAATISTFSPEVVSRQHVDLYARLQEGYANI